MRKRRTTPNFEIVNNEPGRALVLRDLGPWDQFMTVTNGIEAVIEDVRERQLLPGGRRLLYFDSEGQLTEAVLKDDVFSHFRYVPEGEIV